MTSPKLSVVGQQAEAVDIQALNRRDIEARDWSACHIRGDRNPPLPFMATLKRTWIFR